jgi:Ca2+-binding EF-hand superfamily protein
MKIPLVFMMLFLVMAVNVNAQQDPYGRIDTKNLGNINQQGYEMAVLSTFRQNVPSTGMKIDMRNYGNISMQDMQDYRSSVLSTFNQYDLNKDGMISREEFNKMGRMDNAMDFDAIDANGDGRVSHDELLQAMLEKSQASGKYKDAPEKNAGQRQDEAYPTVRVQYDEIDGYYVK